MSWNILIDNHGVVLKEPNSQWCQIPVLYVIPKFHPKLFQFSNLGFQRKWCNDKDGQDNDQSFRFLLNQIKKIISNVFRDVGCPLAIF